LKQILIVILFSAAVAGSRVYPTEVQNTYTLEYQGKYSEALALLEQLTAENPKEYFFALRAGYVAYLAGKYTRSLEHYQNALLLKADALEPRLGKLMPLLALGQYKQAEIEAQAILRSDPRHYTARLKLAYALYLDGSFTKSEKHYAELAADYPSDATVLMGLGWAQIKQGKKAPARAAFERVKLMFPESKYADEGLGWAR
jgi:tetratricopeptide (TPR) repeat protein